MLLELGHVATDPGLCQAKVPGSGADAAQACHRMKTEQGVKPERSEFSNHRFMMAYLF
jgi:hypothetical protein